MEKCAYTFLPGVGIYNIRTGRIWKIYSLEKVRRVFSLYSHLVSNRDCQEDPELFPIAQEMFLEHGKVDVSFERGEHKQRIALDFSNTEASGTRIFSNKKKVDWALVLEEVARRGYRLKRRSYISSVITELCPVYELVNELGEVISEGKGLSKEQAERSALAEAVERMVAGATPAELMLSSASDLFSDKTYFFEPELGERDTYTKDIVTEWLPAYDLINSQDTYFPADLAHYQYKSSCVGLQLFGFTHTTGLAAGSSKEEAAISGLFEVLERDAYWITMRTHFMHPDLLLEEVADLDQKILRINEDLEINGFRLFVKDMSMDWGLPIAHAILVDKHNRIPAFTHGVGAGFSWNIAVQRAVTEVLQMYSAMYKVTHEYEGWKDIVSMRQVMGTPILAWSDPLFKEHITFLTDKSKEIWDKDLRVDSFMEVLENLKSKDYNVLVTPLGKIKNLEVLRVWVDKATSSDQRLERIGERLEKYKKLTGIKDFYSTPILM